MRVFMRIALITVFFLAVSLVSAHAQKSGYVLTEDHYSYGSEILYAVAQKHGKTGNPMQLGDFFLSVPRRDLDAAAKAQGMMPEHETQVISMLYPNVRVDMAGRDGKQTMLLNASDGTMKLLLWGKNIYVPINVGQMATAAQDAQKLGADLQKNLMNNPQIKQMIDNLPEPQRKEALEAMRKAQEMQAGQGMVLGPPNRQTEKSKLVPSGQKGTLNGMAYQVYRMDKGNKKIAYMVSKAYPDLSAQIVKLAETFRDKMPKDSDFFEGTEVMDQLPGAVDIGRREFSSSMMGGSLDVEEAKSLQKKRLGPDTFAVPKHFKPGTMMDLMDAGSMNERSRSRR